jgi:hypothetical protein
VANVVERWDPTAQPERFPGFLDEPDPATTQHEGNWSNPWEPDLWEQPRNKPPAEYKFGPLVGTKKEICRLLGEKETRNPRRLDQKAKLGIVFVNRADRDLWQVWFNDQKAWQRADSARAMNPTPPVEIKIRLPLPTRLLEKRAEEGYLHLNKPVTRFPA